MANRTGGEALVERLALHGVDLLFGIISIHNLDIFDALHRHRDRVRHIGGRSELGCGFMADGYARSSGRPGVLVSSTGPGAANSMHAVGEAYHSSSPLLHLTTTVARGEREQGLGLIHEPKKQFRMLRSVTGHARRVEDPADLAPAVDEAFAALSTGRRRPSVLQFPHDLLGSPCGPGGRRPPDPVPSGAGEEDLEQVLTALRRAERPLIWAGEELAYTGAHGTLIRLAETLEVPVVTGDGAKDAFPEDHPLSLGTCLGQRIWADNPVHDFIPGCDLVLGLGSGFIHRSTVQLGVRLPEQLIQVVADPDYLGRNYPVSLGIVADGGVVASQLLERVQGLDLSTSPGYRDEIRDLKRLIRAELRRQWPSETRAMEAIRSVLPRETITTWDTTVPASRASRAFRAYAPRTFLNPYGWVGIGFSFPAALGAKAAAPANPRGLLFGGRRVPVLHVRVGHRRPIRFERDGGPFQRRGVGRPEVDAETELRRQVPGNRPGQPRFREGGGSLRRRRGPGRLSGRTAAGPAGGRRVGSDHLDRCEDPPGIQRVRLTGAEVVGPCHRVDRMEGIGTRSMMEAPTTEATRLRKATALPRPVGWSRLVRITTCVSV